MEASEIIKKVRKIEIKTRGLSQNIFAGQYHSAFKGRGMALAKCASINMATMCAILIGTSRLVFIVLT